MKSRNIIDSFLYAFSGLWLGLRTQGKLYIPLVLGILAIALGLILGFSITEIVLMAVLMFLVMAMEIFNTALEALVDMVSPEYHPLAKQAKDLSAAAVLVTAFGALVAGALLLLFHLIP